MDEDTALALVGDLVDAAGDDAAVVDGHVLSTDMLHDRTDFPAGVSAYTVGWRAVGASLSDVAAMGADAVAAVAAYGAPTFEESELREVVTGAKDVCDSVGAQYVGGDLDTHEERTIATTALGRAARPVYRSGARSGDRVYVTGTLGRTGVALRLFEAGEIDRANAMFQFDPRVAAGRTLAPAATAMIDSSDGLARSLHQIASASDCGFDIDGSAIPLDPALMDLAEDEQTRRELGWYFGEDFELVCTGPAEAVEQIRDGLSIPLAEVGRVTDAGVYVDGEPLPNRGYQHGGD